MDSDIDTAFVLSGGGNRGAIEAGALLSLLKHNITPQLLVGTSVGALNAIRFAVNPTVGGAKKLIRIWKEATKVNIFTGNYLSMGRRFISSRDSLFDNEKLRHLIESSLPPGIKYFGDMPDIKLRIVAANLNTGEMYVFGHDPSESLVDAAMASTAIPPYLPPWECHGWQYIDGGVVSSLPIGVAIEEHARKIYALDVNFAGEVKPKIKGVFNIAGRAVSIMMYQHFLGDLKIAQTGHTETIYHIATNAFKETHLWNMSNTKDMLKMGEQMVDDFLSQEHPSGYVKYQVP
ncbi:MAG: patatin-like phospholipase family protein [Dehalococcoidia bacterium]|nr:patatin-like phospholipase family protein [Dehalococcoidia bacterium]